MKTYSSIFLLIIISIISCNSPKTEFSLAPIFSNKMVLQQAQSNAVWGTSAPFSKITLTSSWGEQVITQTNDLGSWNLQLPTPEAKKSLHILFSDNLYDWNVPFSDAISWSWVEGPAVTKLGDDWVVYFDQYRKGKFGAIKSKDLENWEDISDFISFPDGIRHGTVFKVSKKELSSLRKYATN